MKEKVTPKCQCSKELPHENEYYQNIIRNSALSVPISPISVEWMNKIQSFIPIRLKRNPQMKEFLACEMLKFKDEYQIGMREAVVKTVINVKHKEEQINIIRSPLKIDEAWRNGFCSSLKILNKKLHRMNRISYRILKICNKYLPTTTMLGFSERSLQHSMTISEMHEAIRRECNKAEFVLMDETWFHDIVKVLTNDLKKALSGYKGDTRETLLNCCNTLLSIKAKTVIEQTIEKYMLLFKDKLVVRSHKAPWKPVLKVSLIVINNEVSSNPTIVELQEAYLAVISILNSSIKRLPVLQSVLKEITRPLKIKVSLDDETFNCKQTELKISLEPFCNELQERIKYFDKTYESLINGKFSKEVHELASQDPKFDELVEKVTFYQTLHTEIQGIFSNEELAIFSVDCNNLKETLSSLTNELITVLLNTLTTMHTEDNLRICKNFQNANIELMKVPENSKEMFEQINYSEDILNNQYPLWLQEVKESARRMFVLLEISTMTMDDVELNAEVQQWPSQLKPLFSQCDENLNNCREKYEELLSKRQTQVYTQLQIMKQRVKELKQNGELSLVPQYWQEVRTIQKYIQDIKEDIKWINNEEVLFNIELTKFPLAQTITEEMEPYIKLYANFLSWEKLEDRWLYGLFTDLNSETIEKSVTLHNQECLKLLKIFKNIQKNELMQQQRGAKQDEVFPPLVICENLFQRISNFKQYLPTLEIICSPGLKIYHWEEMSSIVGQKLIPDYRMTLHKMLSMQVQNYLDKFKPIAIAASKEYILKTTFDKLKSEWIGICFAIAQHEDTYILSSIDEIQLLLDDHILKIQTMKGSPFARPFEKERKIWEKQLLLIEDTIDEWLKVQSQWLYLEPIFSNADIIKQMPTEGELFAEVNCIWKEIMIDVAANPLVLMAVGTSNILTIMKNCNKLIDQINRGLNQYLETKRLFFPRFFFLSDNEILEILSETKNPLRVQPYLKKCFEGIDKLEFDNNLVIYAMFSSEGEKVSMITRIDTKLAHGQVEQWLSEVQHMMVKSLRSIIEQAFKGYASDNRYRWVLSWPGQVVLCVSQIYWTSKVHETIRRKKRKSLFDLCEQLDMQITETANIVRGRVTSTTRITLETLIVIDVHARDVIMELAQKGIHSVDDFQWLAQLRYYWDNSDVKVRIINATINYSYEYLGNTTRLVITPLTDRCYRTLVGAYSLHLNGSLEGPAGTGKTETVKDLAKAIAVQCIVFNCSEGLDYIAMGKFFKGLASTGAWACFDEFNRIEVEVLSVIAQQILSIIRAVQAGVHKLMFEGTELQFNPNTYICITMNPGYSGRSELPDNLRVLFRTVAMMVPDYAMIGEIRLYSGGFVDARNLSNKIVTTYRLCSEQLSDQSHYDYGMRSVIAVLTAANNMKLKFPNKKEEKLLLRSLLDVNLPKFLSHDIPLFQDIISDLFPDTEAHQSDYTEFIAAARKVCTNLNLQPVDNFLKKLIQTYEMMAVRHGFMLLGGPLGGKTTILRVLAETLNNLKEQGVEGEEKVLYRTINPKAITVGQLFGQFDVVSHEWTDGITASIFRKFAVESSERKWIIFDGPVDTFWVESMNTALDDNKKLCLMSGETIQMSQNMNLIFEVMDLTQASPATVSRCGMIYMDPSYLGIQPLIDSWIDSLSELLKTEQEYLSSFCNWLIPASLEFINTNCTQLIHFNKNHHVNNMLKIMSLLISEMNFEENFDSHYLKSWISGCFIFSLTWSIGGMLDSESRIKFSTFIGQIINGMLKSYPIPENIGKVEMKIPPSDTVYHYAFENKGKGSWKLWFDFIQPVDYSKLVNLHQFTIPTVDTIRYTYFLDLFIRCGKPILLVGPTGTGKSSCIKDKLLNALPQEFIPHFFSLSTQITALQTQSIILSKVDKRRKGHYGPPIGKKCVIFIDDINMPAPEKFGAQPPIELLRQLLDHGFWFGLKENMAELYLDDVQFLAAMKPFGTRSNISPRFLHHFFTLGINPFSNETISRIFSILLFTHFKINLFPSEVYSIKDTLVDATLKIYELAVSYLRPTPNKSHYLFNLRDFSKVIQGCCLLQKQSVTGRKIFIRLWVHEIYRVFYDRLIDERDQEWILKTVKQCIHDYFNENFDSLFSYLKEESGDGKGNEITNEDMINLMFGNYMNPDLSPKERLYEEVKDLEAFKMVAILSLREYNMMNKAQLDLVIFSYVLVHLARISRILTIPGGNGLLVGIGGSGRQSLTKLAASMAGQTLFQPEVTKSYSRIEWEDDLKRMLKNSGAKKTVTTFLISDHQITNETFLEDIDSLLNTGEVANLFDSEDRLEIIETVQAIMQEKNRTADYTPIELFSHFVNFCQENLHIIIAMSPVGDTFRYRLQQFPSLINCCTIDWFDKWPDEALELVAIRSFKNLEVSPKLKFNITEVCKDFHKSAEELSIRYMNEMGRYCYVTPSSYLNLIALFKRLLDERQIEIASTRDRYKGGLEKLDFASQQISQMQIALEELKPQLVISAENTEKMLATIEKESSAVAQTREIVSNEETTANNQAIAAQNLKDECESDLKEAIPALEAALAALDTVKPADISLLKSMKNPPIAVKLVMAAVCVMKNIKPVKINDPRQVGKKIFDYWGPSMKALSDLNFFKDLKTYDKDNISPDIMTRIRKEYIGAPEFKPKIVARASPAAEGLCKWVLAMELYDRVAKFVAPKREKLKEAERSLNETLEILKQKHSELKQVEKKLEKLQAELEDMTNQKAALESEVERCSNQLMRAKKMISGLGGERERWELEAERLTIAFENLPGDVLLASAVIAYLGVYTASFRKECIKNWISFCLKYEIPCSTEFFLNRTLGDPLTIQNWEIAGLPHDNFSIDNAVIVDKTNQWSLLIDPQGQAQNWIKNMEKIRKLEMVKFTDKNLFQSLERCIQFGIPVLIENATEEIDFSFYSLLQKQTFTQGGVEMIKLGDKIIEFHSDFKLYITTKLQNPHYLPEITNKVTLINFMITPEGLQDQLLEIVVAKERPNLEKERQELIVQSSENRNDLAKLEETILKTLSSEKNVLEDEVALNILDNSKILADEISVKQKVTEVTEKKIENSRMEYKLVALHSSILFFSIKDLPNIESSYQFSLSWFINLFILSINKSTRSQTLSKRIRYLTDHFTYSLYRNVCRSLFEKDKLAFTFFLCCNLLIAHKQLSPEELQFFLTGAVGLENKIKKPASWIPDNTWDNLCYLSEMTAFDNFIESFQDHLYNWQEVYETKDPCSYPFPQPWQEKLKEFQKILILRCLRPEKVMQMISKFIDNNLGRRFSHPPPSDLEHYYEDSSQVLPLVFILSPGADPLSTLWKFAESKGIHSNNFETISLGQGQGPKAEDMIERCRKKGSWVLIQNCHLAESWMNTLEQICESFAVENTHKDFRLWLTTYSSNMFPVSILQSSVKIIHETPTGLRQNLLRSYLSDPINTEEFFMSGLKEKENFHKLVFSLCFFHAIVQERRTFGPIGWNIPYGFDDSDLRISLLHLKRFMSEYDEIPFKALFYMTGECNYGGRVTDEWDRRCLLTILEDLYSENIISDPKYKLSSSGTYYIPSKLNYEEHIKFIKNLPTTQDPEIFGMHPNVNISKELREMKCLFSSVIALQGKKKQISAKFTDSHLSEIVSDILEKLPEEFDLKKAKIQYPVKYNESMNTVLVQELERYNQLVNIIKTSLKTFQAAIKGTVVLSKSLEDLAGNILIGKVPELWISHSYPSIKPLASYIIDLCERLKFFKMWIDKGKPKTFWLSGFYFTQAFLTGTLQNHARKYTIPIDLLAFDFEVMDSTEISFSTDGAYINGLFLDGARWDKEHNILTEQQNKILYYNMPVIWLKPCIKKEIIEEGRYKTPLYKTGERRGTLSTTGHSTNYVLPVLLPTRKPARHWVKRGTALLCQLDH
ncbi:LOW QUALITY PROTEIN: dynein axonemal heavy chain 7-like [Centruroides vittatus]|uniref:LOW QUALITY PROTEIN: dynein axonemal heavy chain 7-like n=1 Tax=Centruroides vittatus TaxID=120091 RepID=UPI0035105074